MVSRQILRKGFKDIIRVRQSQQRVVDRFDLSMLRNALRVMKRVRKKSVLSRVQAASRYER